MSQNQNTTIAISIVTVLAIGAGVYYFWYKPKQGSVIAKDDTLLPPANVPNLYSECYIEAKTKFPNDAAKRIDYYNTCKNGLSLLQIDQQQTRGGAR